MKIANLLYEREVYHGTDKMGAFSGNGGCIRKIFPAARLASRIWLGIGESW